MSCKRTARRPPRMLRLTIDSLAFGGDGVARDDDGRVTFVPDAAPGDLVEARLVEEHKGFARAALARVIKAGPARVVPPCPLAPDAGREAPCGGCQWQHVALTAQQAAKTEIVRRALRKQAGPVRELLAPAPPLGWRRRARLRIRAGALGLTARRSHLLVDVPACPQLEPALGAALAAVREAVLPVWRGPGAEVELLASARGEVHVAFDAADEAVRAAAATLVGRAGIVGVIVPGAVLGADRIDLADEDAPFWARADVFAQASAAGNAALRALVCEGAAAVGAGGRVLELHAGSGNFTRDLAARFAAVIAVEEAGAAATLATQNLAARGLDGRVRWRAEPVTTALAAVAGERFDLVVLDPPRTGLGAGEAEALAALAPGRIVYVSCDPETLARDLGGLAAAGYRLEWAQPLDLMPQTYHVEVVAALARA